MPENQLLGASKSTTALAEKLFADKSRWVHLWIYKRGMPFLALIAFYIAYYSVNDSVRRSLDQGTAPGWFFPLLAIAIITVAAARVFRARKSLETLSGSYIFTLGYMSLGIYVDLLWMVAIQSGGTTGLFFSMVNVIGWIYFYAGFWAITWLKCKDLVTSEEYFALTLYTAVIYATGPDVSSVWIPIAIQLVPAIYLLYRQRESFRTILFLSAVITYFWIVSEITGIYVMLALAGCIGFIWVVYKALRKLSEEDVSNLLYSFCLAIISGLIFFVVSGLFQFEASRPLTWWIMWACFTAISIPIWRSCGRQIYSIVALWQSYWFTLTLLLTFLDFAEDMDSRILELGVMAIIVSSAVLLRAVALKLDSNRLYVWSRLYLILSALIAISITSEHEDFSWLWLLAVCACFAVAIWLAGERTLGRGLAWWHGVVNPRNIVAMRRIIRKSGNWIVSIPFLGATISAVIKTVALLVHLKRDGRRVDSADLLLIVWSVALSLIVSLSLGAAFGFELYSDLNLSSDQFHFVTTVMMSGVLFSLIGRHYKEPMFPLLGMIAFVLAPVYLFEIDGQVSMTFWLALIVSACCVVFVKDVVEIT